MAGTVNYSARNYNDVAVVDQYGPLRIITGGNPPRDIFSFDSSLMGPEYGTARQQNIVMGFHDASSNIYDNTNRICIGNNSGNDQQEANCIAIGNEAGNNRQQPNCIAIGFQAGQNIQLENSIAIGVNSAVLRQGKNSIAIGNEAGNNRQSENSVAIGSQAGQADQVSHSICIGYKSSITADHENFSKNKISLCLGVREKDHNITGGASYQHSFVVSNASVATLPGPLVDGGVSVNNNTAGDLATKYFNTADDVGFLNIKINRGSDQYVGMMALFNLRKII